MAVPEEFPGVNKLQNYPTGDRSTSLPVRMFDNASVSCWRLEPRELAQIETSGVIWVTTSTYGKLPEPPHGDRWQPAISVTADREIALEGWTQRKPVPEKPPELMGNRSGAQQIAADLHDLREQIAASNDLGSLSTAEAEAAREELWLLEQAFRSESVRIDWIEPIAMSTLRWIAEKAAGSLIGSKAALLITSIATFLVHQL